MTPCEEKGYKVGDRFELIQGHEFMHEILVVGCELTLYRDDGSTYPRFKLSDGRACYINLDAVKKIKPAN